MKNRIISVFTIVALLFSFTSCKKRGEEIPPKDKDLTVENETVEYTDEEINKAATDVADIFVEIASLLGYPFLTSDAKRAEAFEIFKADIMPIILDVSVHKDELFLLIECARECIAISVDENKNDNKLRIISDIYTKFASVMNTDRLGVLVYELEMWWFNRCLTRAEERYDKYGYEFYREDIDHYTALIDEAKTVDSANFADALTVLMVMVSMTLGAVDTDTGVMQISPGDIVTLMKKQSQRFLSMSVTEKEWQTVVKMCEEFIPSNEGASLRGKMIFVLGEEDFFSDLAVAIPELIVFYALVTASLTNRDIDMMENGTPYAPERVLCGKILENIEAFNSLLDSLEMAIPEASDACINAVNSYDKTGYESFVAEHIATRTELISGITDFYSSADETDEGELSSSVIGEKYAVLKNLLIGYVASLNPIVAYVYFYV